MKGVTLINTEATIIHNFINNWVSIISTRICPEFQNQNVKILNL